MEERWLSVVLNDLFGLATGLFHSIDYDYYIPYNVQGKELNKTFKENGIYRFINILYNSEENEMVLIEYEIEYIK